MKKRYLLSLAVLPGVLAAPPGRAQTAPAAAQAPAPQGTVSGVVRQQSDRTTLPGVNVIVKGTTNGTSTGSDPCLLCFLQQRLYLSLFGPC